MNENADILNEFCRIWPRHIGNLVTFMNDCRRHFDGDMDLFLVLCIIGDRTLSERHMPRDMDYGTWGGTPVLGVTSEEINAQSVSDFSGIPRETVRRKLQVLISKGWIVRDEHGYFTATDKAKKDLDPLTLTSLNYLSRMKAALAQ